jgi:HTH-type transcriptional regulator / antitoxin HigA
VRATTVPALYLKLIRQFLLRPVRSDEELERAITVSLTLDKRGRGDLAPEERDYQDVLVTLIAQYEDERHPIPDVSGPDMLRCVIENRGLTQAAVAHGAGIFESALSEILSGRRPMGRKTIESLAAYFRVDPGLFMARVGDRGLSRTRGRGDGPPTLGV